VSQDLPVALSPWSSFQLSPGDHRASIIDIDLSTLIGEPCQKVICPKAHCLKCSIPASCDAYNQILLDKLQRHSILPMLHTLFTEAALPGFDWNSLGPHLEALDSIKSQCMQHTEKKCRKLQMGQVPFSSELMQFYFQQQLWLLVWRKQAGHPVSSSKIR